MRQPVDLVGGFYTDDSLPWSCQDTVNYIPVAAESGGTRTVSKLVDAPGLRPWQWIGNFEAGVDSAPIRGLHDVEGQLFAVCGRTLYQISNAGVAIPRGTIPGVGRVSMAHNQRSTGNELIIVNGQAGYVWNTSAQTFSVITDEGYPGASVVDFIDGYLMQVEPFGRFLFHSNLADALDYNTLDRFEAETSPDRTLGMIVNHQEVWAFGERSIDVFGNAGTAQGTFQNKGVSISRGCAAKWSPAVIDNGVAWLGDDLKVYHAAGYSPTRISTRAIEVALSECSRTDLRSAFSFVWEDLSHAVYYLTVPNGPTFGYDFSTGLWHRRSSWHPEHDLSRRWRINDLVRHNGQWIAGDYQTGKLYVLDWDYMLDGGEPLVRERVSPVAHNDGRAFTIDSAEVFFDTGCGETEYVEFPHQPLGPSIDGQPPGGTVGVEYDSYAFTVAAGDAPVSSVAVVGGSIPPGLDFDGETLSGTPSDVGDFTFTLRVTDENGLTDEVTCTVVIIRLYHWKQVEAWYNDRIRGFDDGGRTMRSVASEGGGSIFANVRSHVSHGAGRWYVELQGIPEPAGPGSQSNIWPTNTESPAVGLALASWVPVGGSLFTQEFFRTAGGDYGGGAFSTNRNVRRTEGEVTVATTATPGIGGSGGENNGSRRIQIAWDAGAGHIWFGVDNTWDNSATPGALGPPSVTDRFGDMAVIATANAGRSVSIFSLSSELMYAPPEGFSPWDIE